MADKVKSQEVPEVKVKKVNKDYIFAVGRRKSAVARVRLYKTLKDDLVWKDIQIKKGDILVNEMPIAEYFPLETMRFTYTGPLRVANAQNKYTFTIRVTGGGQAGQLDAVVAGISNALIKDEAEDYRSILKKSGFLTRDSRVRQRRNVGMGGKSRRKRQSPKR